MSAPNDDIVECPCYPICAALEVGLGPWCRYRPSDLPPPGMHRFDPKESWCPPGVRANLLMLSYLVSGGALKPEEIEHILQRIRRWPQELRAQAGGALYPERHRDSDG